MGEIRAIEEFIYTDIQYTRLFAEFEKGINDVKKLEKRLKTKKVEVDEPERFEAVINVLKRDEEQYFKYLVDLLQETDQEVKLGLQEELSYMIHMKYGLMNSLFDWETELRWSK